jgi:hypothetical protein
MLNGVVRRRYPEVNKFSFIGEKTLLLCKRDWFAKRRRKKSRFIVINYVTTAVNANEFMTFFVDEVSLQFKHD